MVHKKKFPGGLTLFFGVLFSLLFVFSSTSCFARTTLTDDEANYIYDYIFKNTYNSNYLNFTSSDLYSYVKNTIFQEGASGFKTWFNNNNTLDIDTNSTIFWFRVYSNTSGALYFGNFNNSKPGNDDLPFFYIHFNPSKSTQLEFLAIDDNKQPVSNYGIRAIDMNFNSSSITYTQYRNSTVGTSLTSYGYNWLTKPSSWNINNINNGDSLLENIEGIVSFSNTNAIYTNYNGQTFFNSPVTRLLQTQFIDTSVPEEPENPDNTTGTITDNNGDTTGKIDLSGIENGITDVKNQISGDTQIIIENQNTIAQQQHNDLTSQPDLSETEITQQQIDDALDFDFMADPYANFWLQMTTGLSGSLTNTVRQIPVNWLGYQGVFDLDNLGFNYPASIRLILTSITTVSMVWLLVKWWKIIIDKLTSGDMDEVLAMNEEERNY